MALPQLNTSKFNLTIPSTGQEVEYRPYLVKEEKILMMALESKDQKQVLKAVSEIIEVCIFDTIDTSKLAMFDIEYIFLQLRSKSVGEIITVDLKCDDESCKAGTPFDIRIDEIKPPVMHNKTTIALTDTVGLTVRFPNMLDIEAIDQTKLNTVDGASEMFSRLIISIYDGDELHIAADTPHDEMMYFLDNLSSAQYAKMTEFLNDLPSMTHNVSYNCIKCKKQRDIELKGLASFFT
jgi:hypothetical protein